MKVASHSEGQMLLMSGCECLANLRSCEKAMGVCKAPYKMLLLRV